MSWLSELVMMKHNRASLRLFLRGSLVFFVLALSVRGQQTASHNAKDGSEGNKCKLVVVIGAVRIPSRFEFRRNVRLKELIGCVGGFADKVGKAVQIVHTRTTEDCAPAIDAGPKTLLETIEIFGTDDVLRGEEKANPVIHPGDIVVVPERDPIFVTGGIVAPQAIYPIGKTTLTQAIAMTGGLVHGNKPEKIKIVRQDVGSSVRTEITVDLKAIKQHRVEDPVLQAYDIIDVPESRHGGDKLHGHLDLGAIPLRPLCEDSRFLGLRK